MYSCIITILERNKGLRDTVTFNFITSLLFSAVIILVLKTKMTVTTVCLWRLEGFHTSHLLKVAKERESTLQLSQQQQTRVIVLAL